MLLLAAVSCLLVFVDGSTVTRPILVPATTACTAPSGSPGDCLLSADCPADRGPPSRHACGIEETRLKFCCESETALPADCGLSGREDMAVGDGSAKLAIGKIIDGHVADAGTWPWAALLGRSGRDYDDTQWICGGALLGPRHVLTAAHCLMSSNDTLVVRLGEHDLSAENGTRQDRHVSRVVRHPDFRGGLADLALLVLDSPVKLSRGVVHPVCLPPPDAPLVGREGYTVGWGAPSLREPPSKKLLEALVSVMETEPCERFYQRFHVYTTSYFPGGWNGSVLCAEDRDGNYGATCHGNSGGPLSVRRPDGRYHLAGLVLFNEGCSGESPVLYTNVKHYVDWIRREVERS